jgi:hypothetical protein
VLCPVLWSLFVSRTTESPLCGCCAAAAIVPALVSATASGSFDLLLFKRLVAGECPVHDSNSH